MNDCKCYACKTVVISDNEINCDWYFSKQARLLMDELSLYNTYNQKPNEKDMQYYSKVGTYEDVFRALSVPQLSLDPFTKTFLHDIKYVQILCDNCVASVLDKYKSK